MPKLQPTDDVLAARARANVAKYTPQIIDHLVKQANKDGHHISKKNVKRVTFTRLTDVAYEIFAIEFGKFVITDADDLIWLDGMTWTNNSPGNARRTLRVERSTEDTYTWQITAGFTYKYEQSEELKIYAPAGGSIKTSFSFSFDLHASYGQASKKVHAWKNDFEQEIPAYTVVRMEVRGVQFVGYVPFTVRARATGKAQCECVIDYWGTHTRSFAIDLPRILTDQERTFVSQGRVDGVQGYDWKVDSSVPAPIAEPQRQSLPQGVTEQHLVPRTLDLPRLARSGTRSRPVSRK